MTGYATAETAIEADGATGAFHYNHEDRLKKTRRWVNLVEKAYTQRHALQREKPVPEIEIRAGHHSSPSSGTASAILRLIATLQADRGGRVTNPVLLAGEAAPGPRLLRAHRALPQPAVRGSCGVPSTAAGRSQKETLLSEALFRGPVRRRGSDVRSLFGEGRALANHGHVYLADFAEAGRKVLERINRFLADKRMVLGGGNGTRVALDIRSHRLQRRSPWRKLARKRRTSQPTCQGARSRGRSHPALREHLEDVPLLLHHFCQEANRERKKNRSAGSLPPRSPLSKRTAGRGTSGSLADLVRAVRAGKKQGTMIDARNIPPEILYRNLRTHPPGNTRSIRQGGVP